MVEGGKGWTSGRSLPFRGILAVGREKKGNLATTSLEFEYLHRKRRCEMLIGRDDISNDLSRVFQCLLKFELVSASQ